MHYIPELPISTAPMGACTATRSMDVHPRPFGTRQRTPNPPLGLLCAGNTRPIYPPYSAPPSCPPRSPSAPPAESGRPRASRSGCTRTMGGRASGVPSIHAGLSVSREHSSAVSSPGSPLTSVTVYRIPPGRRMYAYSASSVVLASAWTVLPVSPPYPTENRACRTHVTIRAFCLRSLKCGSGNKKKILVNCPLRKKLGMCFIELARMTLTFSKDPGALSGLSAGRRAWI